jgi:hypothetical protein
LSIVTFAFIGLSASCATTNAPASSDIYPFHSVVVRDDAIIATLPNIGTRWIVREGTADSHLSSYGEAFTLKAGSSLHLIEHHSSCQATAQLTPSPGLKMESHFDGSSFGTTNTDKSYFIPAR